MKTAILIVLAAASTAQADILQCEIPGKFKSLDNEIATVWEAIKVAMPNLKYMELESRYGALVRRARSSSIARNPTPLAAPKANPVVSMPFFGIPANKPSAPAIARPVVPAAANKPSAPVANKSSVPVVARPFMPAVRKPFVHIATRPAVPVVASKPIVPVVANKPVVPNVVKPFVPVVASKPSVPVAATQSSGTQQQNDKSLVLTGVSLSNAFAAKVLNKPLAKNTLVGTTSIPKNFNLSFTINLTSTGLQSRGWRSIFHFTSDGQNAGVLGSRSPALWLKPGTSELYVGIGTTSNHNWYFMTKAIPLNQKILVSIYAVDQFITVYYSGVRVHSAVIPGTRYVGNAFLYAANPFHDPAIATLSSFEFNPHSSTTPADPEVAIKATRVEAVPIVANKPPVPVVVSKPFVHIATRPSVPTVTKPVVPIVISNSSVPIATNSSAPVAARPLLVVASNSSAPVTNTQAVPVVSKPSVPVVINPPVAVKPVVSAPVTGVKTANNTTVPVAPIGTKTNPTTLATPPKSAPVTPNCQLPNYKLVKGLETVNFSAFVACLENASKAAKKASADALEDSLRLAICSILRKELPGIRCRHPDFSLIC